MSCSEHNVTGCLTCLSLTPICVHGTDKNCPQCDPIGSRQRKVTAMQAQVDALKATLSMERQRANMLGDELGAMRSDRDAAYAQLRQMHEAFERQSRQLAKLQGIKTK